MTEEYEENKEMNEESEPRAIYNMTEGLSPEAKVVVAALTEAMNTFQNVVRRTYERTGETDSHCERLKILHRIDTLIRSISRIDREFTHFSAKYQTMSEYYHVWDSIWDCRNDDIDDLSMDEIMEISDDIFRVHECKVKDVMNDARSKSWY